jgi:transcriptional pleiotropic regulator of transition state genes
MIDTGVTRPLDNLGRIVLPIELRNTLDIKTNDSLEVFVDGN